MEGAMPTQPLSRPSAPFASACESGPGAFWAYSLHIYAQRGVSEACLALQDNAGADVNIALFALWAASLGQRLLPADFTAVEARVQPWRTQVVHPLRAARRALKPLAVTDDARRLYASVKGTELEAERQQQALMEPMLPSRGPDVTDTLAETNLAAYATSAGLRFPDPAVAALAGATRTFPASPE
jgi:uncharacterized protein (TIGR02444 family)